MKVGDKVFCKNRGKAVILHLDDKNTNATILFLKIGMYNPEIVDYKELEKINESG